MLKGKLSLVTGSFGGIGLQVAKSLASAGSDVVINDLRAESSAEVRTLVNELSNQYKTKIWYEKADLSRKDEIENMFASINSKCGTSLDVLVNNAGIQHVSPVESFPVDKWDAIIRINLTSLFHTTRLAIPFMKRNNWGRIINIASVHGLVASANKSAYVAAKHGVMGFTKAVALENARTGITANCICPGWVLTPLVEKQIEDRSVEWGISIDEARDRLLSEKQPSGKFVTAEQLGQLALFMASDAAAEVRGVAWNMDGGWTAQ